jgi:hypothetical protein
MKRNLQLAMIGCLATFLIAFSGCKKDLSTSVNNDENNLALSAFKSNNNDPEELTFYALRNGNVLDKYSTTNPETVLSTTTISGLGGASILAIDFRPSTGGLYGLGSDDRVYLINLMTGAATAIPALFTTANRLPPVDATTTRIPVSVDGTQFGFDFNPMADRLRIVSNTGQSLRINVMTGFTLIDGSINPQPATITGVAYDKNDNDPATATELYAIDVLSLKLFEIDPPNNGTLVEEGPINLKLVGEGGFDIAPRNSNVITDIGLGLYEVNKKSTLFRIDVETGETKILAKYNKTLNYTGLAISPSISN